MPENTIKESYTLEEILNLLDQNFLRKSRTINPYDYSFLENHERKVLLEKIFSIQQTIICVDIGKLFDSFQEIRAVSIQVADDFTEIDDYIESYIQMFFLDITNVCAYMYKEFIPGIRFEAVKLIDTKSIPIPILFQILEELEELFLS